jgi:hypothetical protein
MGKIATTLAVTAIGLLISIPSAMAFPPIGTPTTINPGDLFGSGLDSKAIFVFSDAGDDSTLTLTGHVGTIFDNKINVAGDTVDLGSLSGMEEFGLDDMTEHDSFLADVADVDHDFHLFYTTNYANFGEGPVPAAAAAAISSLPLGSSVIFVGWEDRDFDQGSDFDYNDLIFAFSNLKPATVPEPLTISLFGAGLVGAAAMRRRKKNSA